MNKYRLEDKNESYFNGRAVTTFKLFDDALDALQNIDVNWVKI